MKLSGVNILSWFSFACLYGALAFICLQVRDPWSLSSFIWLPAGLTLTLLCVTEWHQWPIWLTISSALHAGISLAIGRTLDVVTIFTFGDIFIITTIAVLWRGIAKRSYRYNYSSLNGFFILSVLVMCFVGALILFLFISLNYPVSISHSAVWAVSEASGILAVSSYFTLTRAGSYLRVSPPVLLHFKEFIRWGVFAVLAYASYNLCTLAGYSSAIAFTAVFLVIVLSVVTSLFFNALHTSAFIQFCAVMISLSALLHTGPFLRSGNDVFLSQLYLLFLTLIASVCFARISDLRLAHDTNLKLYELIVEHAPFNEFCRFSYHPEQDVLHWHERIPLKIQNVSLLSSSALLVGRFCGEHQEPLRTFFAGNLSRAAKPAVEVFCGDFLNEDLKYVPVTLAFMPAESRYGNLRLEGVLVFH